MTTIVAVMGIGIPTLEMNRMIYLATRCIGIITLQQYTTASHQLLTSRFIIR